MTLRCIAVNSLGRSLIPTHTRHMWVFHYEATIVAFDFNSLCHRFELLKVQISNVSQPTQTPPKKALTGTEACKAFCLEACRVAKANS